MAEFERKLVALADRGNHVGSEEMIERVEAVLARDPLVVVEQRRKGMTMSVKTDHAQREGKTRRTVGFAWGLAAFLVVGTAGVIFWMNTGNESPVPPAQPATTVPQTTPTTIPETSIDATSLEGKIGKIEAMVATWNSGDFQAWRDSFEVIFPVIFGGQVTDESQLEWQRSVMAANEVWTITGECTLRGSGPIVICPMEQRNEFHEPGGLFFATPEMQFLFNNQGELTGITADFWDIAGDPQEYNAAFEAWLAETHPDVYANFSPTVEGENGLPSAEDMPTALQYVDEFIAQSDVYPLSP